MERPEGRTHTLLSSTEHQTGNLIITGGPAVNPAAQEFDNYFDISYVYCPGSFFQITTDTYTLTLNLSDYPHKDIFIIHLGKTEQSEEAVSQFISRVKNYLHVPSKTSKK